jgi:hypothetical protein
VNWLWIVLAFFIFSGVFLVGYLCGAMLGRDE